MLNISAHNGLGTVPASPTVGKIVLNGGNLNVIGNVTLTPTAASPWDRPPAAARAPSARPPAIR